MEVEGEKGEVGTKWGDIAVPASEDWGREASSLILMVASKHRCISRQYKVEVSEELH